MPITTPLTVIHNAFDTAARKVAVIQIDPTKVDAELERAYMLTNNIDTAWIENEDVQVAQGVLDAGGCRSTSMGDICQVGLGDNATYYHCAMCGWDEITHDVFVEMLMAQQVRVDAIEAERAEEVARRARFLAATEGK